MLNQFFAQVMITTRFSKEPKSSEIFTFIKSSLQQSELESKYVFEEYERTNSQRDHSNSSIAEEPYMFQHPS